MSIINIRGSSGSGKSTLVKRLLEEHYSIPIERQLSDWKKPKVVAYQVATNLTLSGFQSTYVVGPYRTQCGGCDALSYKGSHNDIEAMVREFAEKGNVVFEGLTISSTVTRWMNVSKDYPGRFVWMFMMTPEEECHQRILARNGGKEPKIHNGLADYQVKYRGCMRHIDTLIEQNEQVLGVLSDDHGYKSLLEALNAPAQSFAV